MQNYYYDYYWNRNSSNERVFWVPFLLGGLGGAAVVGLSRPRPVYVNQPYNQQIPQYYNRPPYPYAPYSGYNGGYSGYSNYNYYY